MPWSSPHWCHHDNTLMQNSHSIEDYKSLLCLYNSKLTAAAFVLFALFFMATLQVWWWTMCDVAAGRAVKSRPGLRFFFTHCKKDILGGCLFVGYFCGSIHFITLSFMSPAYSGNVLLGACGRDALATVNAAHGPSPLISTPAFVLFAWIFFKLRCLMNALQKLGGGGRTKSRKRYVQKLQNVEKRLKQYCFFYVCFIVACLPFQKYRYIDIGRVDSRLEDHIRCHLLSPLSSMSCHPLPFRHISLILAWVSKQALTLVLLAFLFIVSVDDFSM